MARGNERRRIYRDADDRKAFLTTLEQSMEGHGLRVHGFCLMPNHYHLLVETPRGNLSRALGWLQTTYTIRFNRRHHRSGHLFQGRFKAHVVEADGYAMELLRYIHLNPVRPQDKSALVPVERRKRLEEYRWSSHRFYLGYEMPPRWLSTDWLGAFGSNRLQAMQDYRRFVDDAFERIIENPWENLYAGLVLGGQEMQERISGLLRKKPGGEKITWGGCTEDGIARKAAASKLADEQSERCWKVWLRVRHGGEKRIDVARSFGYKDGSAITQILKRLETRLMQEPSYLSGPIGNFVDGPVFGLV